MSAGILDGFQTIIPTAAAVLLKKRQMLRLTQQEIADRAKITLRQYQRLESGERSILTCSFGLACRVIEALDTESYYHYFLSGEIYRDCCYQCPYAQRQRVGDITIGDYWGVQKYDPQLLVEQGGTINSKEGVSCLLINTERGQHLVEKYGAKIESYPVEFSNIA